MAFSEHKNKQEQPFSDYINYSHTPSYYGEMVEIPIIPYLKSLGYLLDTLRTPEHQNTILRTQNYRVLVLRMYTLLNPKFPFS